MLENCASAKERWGGVSEIIDRWLQERQDMLVQYCSLPSQRKRDKSSDKVEVGLQQLCQILVDYTSAGHFEIYDQLIREGKEFNDAVALKEAEQLYAKVDKTTEFVLDFNDKYEATDDLTTLDEDLSVLGEVLATRFEAEDRMIAVLHDAHSNLVN